MRKWRVDIGTILRCNQLLVIESHKFEYKIGDRESEFVENSDLGHINF